MKNTSKTFAAAAMALLFLAACGSSGGGLGDILGGGGSPTSTASNEIRGTVDSVDLQSRSIWLTNVYNNGSMLSSGGNNGSSVRVFFDNRTVVDYQGRSYRPEDLERGDQIAVRVDQPNGNNQLYATSMTVLSDARASGSYPSNGGGSYPSNGGSYPSNGSYGSNLRGTIRSIDTYRRTMSVDTGYGSYTTVEYATNTPVSFNGRSYQVADLEVGDEIDIRLQNSGNNRAVASDITVTRSVSNNNNTGIYNGGTTNASTIRGTVQSVNTSNRTITLNSVNWSNFNRGSNNGSTITVYYDANTNVDVSGQLYPVSGLERGDVVDVQVSNNGSSNYFAQRIILVRDINR